MLTVGERGGGLKMGRLLFVAGCAMLCCGMKLKWEEGNNSKGVSWCPVEMGDGKNEWVCADALGGLTHLPPAPAR